MRDWTDDAPSAPGHYWCSQRGEMRIVKVWCYPGKPEGPFFTNEDCGASVTDREVYDGALWSKEPIREPEPPPAYIIRPLA